MKYRAIKDKETGKWYVERDEPFFELPIVFAIVGSRQTALAMIKSIRAGIPHQKGHTVGI